MDNVWKSFFSELIWYIRGDDLHLLPLIWFCQHVIWNSKFCEETLKWYFLDWPSLPSVPFPISYQVQRILFNVYLRIHNDRIINWIMKNILVSAPFIRILFALTKFIIVTSNFGSEVPGAIYTSTPYRLGLGGRGIDHCST